MTAERRIFVLGVAAVLLIATLGAAAARILGFQYWLLSAVSLVVYAAAGFAATRAGAGIGRATMLGVAIGLVDVTLGWALSAAIGPGRLQDSPFTGLTAIVIGGLTALALYAITTALGALAARQSVR